MCFGSKNSLSLPELSSFIEKLFDTCLNLIECGSTENILRNRNFCVRENTEVCFLANREVHFLSNMEAHFLTNMEVRFLANMDGLCLPQIQFSFSGEIRSLVEVRPLHCGT